MPRPTALLFFVFLVCGGGLFAHMDPLGETHPTVLVEGDQFHVYFRDNRLEGAEGNDFFRRIYGSNGKLLSDRAVAPDGPVIIESFWSHYVKAAKECRNKLFLVYWKVRPEEHIETVFTLPSLEPECFYYECGGR